MTHKQKFAALAVAIGIVSASVSAYMLLRKPQTAIERTVPTISRRAGEAKPSSEYLNAERTVEYYREQIRLHPNVIKNYIELAQVFMQEARVTGNHHEYVPKANNLLDMALSIAPNNFDALLTKSSLLLTFHQFKNARELAERCVAQNTHSAAALGALCDAQVELGEYETAVKTADKMTATRPDLRAYARVSYLREIHGDLGGATDAMRLAADAGVTGQENRAWVLYNLGNLFIQQNKMDTATFIFKGILDERPQYPYAMAGLARVKAAKDDLTGAVELLVSAVQLTPEHTFIEQIADVYRASNELESSHAMAERALQAFLQHEQEGWNIDREYAVFCLNHDMNLPEALTRAKRDYESRPDNIDALDTYAFALVKNGRAPEAPPFIERAMRLGTKNASLHYHAGLIYQALGQSDKSKMFLQQALRENLAAQLPYAVDARRMMAAK